MSKAGRKNKAVRTAKITRRISAKQMDQLLNAGYTTFLFTFPSSK